jgi:cation transport regulator ChaC
MTIRTIYHVAFASLALVAAGCQQSTTPDDVADAREELREQEQDVAEVEREGAADIADEQADLRHETMKPALDEDARDEQRDVTAAQEDANAAIKEEQQDVRDAARDLKQTEEELAATTARDAFAAETEAQLKAADDKIAAWKDEAGKLEGAEKDAVDAKIQKLQT